MTDTVPLQLEALLAAARERNGGLSDFGDPIFRVGLQKLIDAVESEANMSPFGLSMFTNRIIESLGNRLLLEDYCRRHPEILDEQIENPIAVLGLPRTGTTMLHRTLACDPRLYTLIWWESRFPAPLPGETLQNPVLRQEQARAEVKMMLEAMPALLSIHPFDADLADEEVVLMEHSFFSAMDAYGNVPSYTDWLHQQDQTPAYEYLRKQLQFVQWQKRQRGIVAQRWVLKAPHHIHFIDTLFKVFPGLKVIQTHRDPLQTVPSMASFAYTIWGVYGADPDAKAAGRIWSGKFARGLKHTMDVRETLPPGRIMDVWYLDAVARPMDVVRQIYPFIGMELTPEIEKKMQDWAASAGREQRPPHEYSAEKTGLTDEKLKQDFRGYRERYILPRLK